MGGRGPSLGPPTGVRDEVVARQLQQLLSRIATLEAGQAGLTLSGISASAAVKLSNQPIQQLKDPTYGQDAVNLRSLMRYVENRLAQFQEEIDAASDDEVDGGDNIGGGSAPPTIPFLDFTAESRSYGDAHPAELANSCQRAGGTWDYMDGLVAFLRTQPNGERVGYNGKRGDVTDPSLDAVAVYHGVLPPVAGSNDVWVVDVVGCHCGPEDGEPCVPYATWNNATTSRAAGAFLFSR